MTKYLLDITVLGGPGSSPNLLPSIISIGSMIISLVAVIVSLVNTRRTLATNLVITERTLGRKKVEDRKSEIYKMLNDLYGPFSLLKKKSRLLYEKFKEGKSPNKDGVFSTLIYLLQDGGPQNLSANDQTLLAEIINIGRQCEILIDTKSGLVDDDDVRDNWLPKLSKHYLIIRLAYQGVLKGQVDMYKDSTFPDEIDMIIKNKIDSLHKELRDLG